jgi:hypothetical protein
MVDREGICTLDLQTECKRKTRPLSSRALIGLMKEPQNSRIASMS